MEVDTEDLAHFQSLLDGPSAAVLMTYRNDGTAASSPVWFRLADSELQVVIAEGDVKLKHLASRPVCSLLVFETVAPFRGLRVEGTPTLRREGVTAARLAIASRYLGPEGGERFTEARGRALILSLPLSQARSWDLSAILP